MKAQNAQKVYEWVLIGMMRRGGGISLRAWASEEILLGRKVVYNEIGFLVYERRQVR